MSYFFFCHYVFKKPSAAEASESVYMRERVNEVETVWQYEKLLSMSNLYLCHNVLKCRLLQRRQTAAVGGNEFERNSDKER